MLPSAGRGGFASPTVGHQHGQRPGRHRHDRRGPSRWSPRRSTSACRPTHAPSPTRRSPPSTDRRHDHRRASPPDDRRAARVRELVESLPGGGRRSVTHWSSPRPAAVRGSHLHHADRRRRPAARGDRADGRSRRSAWRCCRPTARRRRTSYGIGPAASRRRRRHRAGATADVGATSASSADGHLTLDSMGRRRPPRAHRSSTPTANWSGMCSHGVVGTTSWSASPASPPCCRPASLRRTHRGSGVARGRRRSRRAGRRLASVA